MSNQTNNSDFIKYLVTAGLAGACVGYFLSSKAKTNKIDQKNTQTIIDLDKFNDKSQFKIVPLLNRYLICLSTL
jgi:hypothetical protein